MKREIVPRSKILLFFYRVLMVLVIAALLVLAAGSLYGILRPSNSGPLFRIGSEAELNRHSDIISNANIFTGIGRLRIPAAGQQAAVIILSIYFPYPADDGPFSEELASCVDEFRSIAIRYFSSLPSDKIANIDENVAKDEILKQFNALLRLGKIETLFFSDLMIVD
jgi:flagellar basal body-associated protein FliL